MFVLPGTGWRFTSKHICFSISPRSRAVWQHAAVHSTGSCLTYSVLSFLSPMQEKEGWEDREEEGVVSSRQLMLLLLLSQFPLSVFCTSVYSDASPPSTSHCLSVPSKLCDDCTWSLAQVSTHRNPNLNYLIHQKRYLCSHLSRWY